MVEEGETVILDVVAPVLQEYVVPPDAVSVKFPPMQIAAVAGMMEAVKVEVTVTVPEADAVHPPAPVAVTLYIVVVLGLTVMLPEVAPVLHE